MAETKRTAFQIDRDRREIAARYLQGWTQQEIADHLNQDKSRGYELSRQMISYDLRRIQEQWIGSSLIDFNEAKARELAKIDHLERVYWDAWERSCEDEETKRIEGGLKDGPSKQTMTVKGQVGDPRFLQGIERCIERRCKILGVDAPIGVRLTDDQLLTEYKGLLASLAAAQGTGDGDPAAGSGSATDSDDARNGPG